MKLILLRHGDALPGFDDANRSLSDLGEKQADQAARTLLRLNISPDIIMCSPLLRAQKTADKIRVVLTTSKIITSEYLTPTSDHRQIIEILRKLSQEVILLVGHEPHLSSLISILTLGTHRGRFEMSKGGIAILESVNETVGGNFTLRLLIRTDELSVLLNK
jgi:phosphohistidine phosphatase